MTRKMIGVSGAIVLIAVVVAVHVDLTDLDIRELPVVGPTDAPPGLESYTPDSIALLIDADLTTPPSRSDQDDEWYPVGAGTLHFADGSSMSTGTSAVRFGVCARLRVGERDNNLPCIVALGLDQQREVQWLWFHARLGATQRFAETHTLLLGFDRIQDGRFWGPSRDNYPLADAFELDDGCGEPTVHRAVLATLDVEDVKVISIQTLCRE